MQKIPITLATSGMTLARPVCKDGGSILLAQGIVLSKEILETLSSSGVESLVVRGFPLEGERYDYLVSYSRLAGRLNYLFRRQTDNKWMMQLKSILDKYCLLQQRRESEDFDEECNAPPPDVETSA